MWSGTVTANPQITYPGPALTTNAGATGFVSISMQTLLSGITTILASIWYFDFESSVPMVQV